MSCNSTEVSWAKKIGLQRLNDDVFVITRIVKTEADDSKLWNDNYIILNYDTYIDYYSLFGGDIVVLSSLPNSISSCYISASVYDSLNESKDYSIIMLQYDLDYDVNG